jgi:FlaA1/EpsC-like NDP-sugar epimerase
MKRFRTKFLLINALDISIVMLSYLLAQLIINNFTLSEMDLTQLNHFYYLLPIYLLAFFIFKLDKSLWRFASVDEAVKVLLATLASSVIILSSNGLFNLDIHSNTIVMANVFIFIFLTGIRFSYRALRLVLSLLEKEEHDLKRTLIIGAGNAANLLIKEIRNNPMMKNKVVCLVDDDKNKIDKMVLGIKVAGTLTDLEYLVKHYLIDEIIIAIPSATKSEIQKILQHCESFKIKVKILPPFYELMDKKISVNKIRDVQIEDLLGREQVRIDPQGLQDFIKGEVVLVTGGGGSIGSELCRQIVKFNPKQLIILDIYENNAYEIQNELLRHVVNDTDILALIASVRDVNRMEEVFNTYRPTVVFHAAAHKHVPLMEVSPKEAIKNNVFGTHNLVRLSDHYKVKKFVLISTDKAVNPTNIMGATKRYAEMIIQAYGEHSETQFAAVRFGNVLGSNGSVIPLFKKQIQEGGPVTVTHKDIIRYFMTIPEAVQLVLQAGAFAKGGEIFVLDMGEPVKILHLAEQLIRFSGFEPYKEIDIQITGLRPGEKLYEELLMDTEGLTKTENKKIFVLTQVESNKEEILHSLDRLEKLINRNTVNIQDEFGAFVSTYKAECKKVVNR